MVKHQLRKRGKVAFMKKNQSDRLTEQQENIKGANGIFDKEARKLDKDVSSTESDVMSILCKKYPNVEFRHRKTLTKKEINEKLKQIDSDLGQILFVENSCIKPDGGIIEARDDYGNWRVILVSEAKYQGKDIENIKKGRRVGKNKDKDLTAAGNAIERAHKNISEIANFMLKETYFPYVLFLSGSNFLTQTIVVKKPDGSEVTLLYNSGTLNRIDRLTAANYGLPLNTNLCENRFVSLGKGKSIMLQAASIYAQPEGGEWDYNEMCRIMLDIAITSLKNLANDMFKTLTKK